MSRIRLLDSALINKIAAGEVIDRPASIVKELFENSADAGASSVTIETQGGGAALIRVTDNGVGIPKADCAAAFLRHSTSKIESFDDLLSIATMGFRGEALASIAAVAKVTLVTKPTGQPTGTRIEISGGELISEKDAGCADGTTLIVRDLFFNTPARRKFLKKAQAESAYIDDIVKRLALSRPDISVRLIRDGQSVLKTVGGGLKSAMAAVYGSIGQKLAPVNASEGGYSLSGFVGVPEISRASRSAENFFIGSRYIKNRIKCSTPLTGSNDLLRAQFYEAIKQNINEVLP